MSTLTAARFAEFYRAVYGDKYAPFPWQERLVARVIDPDRGWPSVIALPTAAGKTTCIDIAVFALACQADWGAKRTAPRRIFFVVDRRVVVDQAYLHAKRLEEVLRDPKPGVVAEAAAALKRLADDECPLDVYALRGGMYRETAWARTPLQPTVIASTVDQVGSRLLFRGYGVSDSSKPIHAGLVGNDAIILLDEAHCSQPFRQTASAVTKYREWAEAGAPRSPFRFVQMTATPAADAGDVEQAEEDDWNNDILSKRFHASKPAKLIVAEKAKGKTWKQYGPYLVATLKEQARALMGQTQNGEQEVRAVGVIVNRVATARALKVALEAEEGKKPETRRAKVILLTGRMRPVDRDVILKQIAPLFSGHTTTPDLPQMFVVATQCLEVGADLDFHALVTECASLDALRQRFGRLNRDAQKRTFAPAAIVIREDQTEDTSEDPVYGPSLAETWKFFRSGPVREEVDFGIAAMRTLCDGLTDVDYKRLNSPTNNAPVLLPAHLDCWVQTCPIPSPDPDPAVFLHGPQAGPPDVQVVFRADLGTDDTKWVEVVVLCPPSSSEALPVRIDVFRRWLARRPAADESGDIEGEAGEDTEGLEPAGQTALLWMGLRHKDTKPVTDLGKVQPGMTYVVNLNKASAIELLGDFPLSLPPDDVGDEAFQRSRDRAILRLPELELDRDDEEFDAKVTVAIEAKLGSDAPKWLSRAVDYLKVPKNRRVLPYPEPLKGYVVVGRKRLNKYDPAFLEEEESSESPSGRPVLLDEHCLGVSAHARRFAAGCGLPDDVVERFALGGQWHDVGKLDPRFQAMLQGRSPRTVRRPPWAKSENGGGTWRERKASRTIHRYPSGGRHELLSVALAEVRTNDDLLLHLIATHHGYARPFAPPVEEDKSFTARPFTDELFGETFTAPSAAQTIAAWNCKLPERFWRVVRRYGWWGSAYLEAVFRLADHMQSWLEQEKEATTRNDRPSAAMMPTSTAAPALHPIPLSGLDGSNPLAFLAAVGLLRVLSLKAEDWIPRLSWKLLACWVPVIWIPSGVREAALCETLADQLATMRGHPALRLGHLEADNLVVSPKQYAAVCLTAAGEASRDDRVWADFCTAFGSEVVPSENDRELIQDTAFRTMSGSGHQDFLAFFRNIVGATKAGHLEKALLQPWRYNDPLRNMTTRWDPQDDVRYALRWKNPSSENTLRSRSGSVLGANRLAIEALPLFPSVPVGSRLMTTGFMGRRSSDTFFTWPIWGVPHSIDVVRSLLALEDLQQTPADRNRLTMFNIREVFRSQRITIGKYRNFTPSQSV
jgi:CRISPR-associated endonuclease/helicase Cas3